jgi:hypothetical protein
LPDSKQIGGYYSCVCPDADGGMRLLQETSVIQ